MATHADEYYSNSNNPQYEHNANREIQQLQLEYERLIKEQQELDQYLDYYVRPL